MKSSVIVTSLFFLASAISVVHAIPSCSNVANFTVNSDSTCEDACSQANLNCITQGFSFSCGSSYQDSTSVGTRGTVSTGACECGPFGNRTTLCEDSSTSSAAGVQKATNFFAIMSAIAVFAMSWVGM